MALGRAALKKIEQMKHHPLYEKELSVRRKVFWNPPTPSLAQLPRNFPRELQQERVVAVVQAATDALAVHASSSRHSLCPPHISWR